MPRKTKTGPNGKKPSKTGFVRDYLKSHAGAKPLEIVAAAKAAKISITASHVSNIKSTLGSKKGKPGRPKGSKNRVSALRGRGSTDLAAFNAFAEAVVAAGGSQAAQRFLSALEALGI